MKNFRTFKLAVSFYKSCQKQKMPNRFFRDQCSRASLSIVLNLSEGAGRIHPKDRKRFYSIALGSLREVQGVLYLLENEQLIEQGNVLGAHILKLIKNPGSPPI